VTVTPSAATIPSGQQLTYTVDVKNSGGDITTGTTLNTQVQGMTSLVLTSNVGSCSQSANQVTCNAGILQGFQSWQVTIRGTVTAANGTPLNQGVTVTGNHTSSGYDTTTTASTIVLVNNNASGPLPDLMTSVQGPGNIADNTTGVTYQVTVNNPGMRFGISFYALFQSLHMLIWQLDAPDQRLSLVHPMAIRPASHEQTKFVSDLQIMFRYRRRMLGVKTFDSINPASVIGAMTSSAWFKPGCASTAKPPAS